MDSNPLQYHCYNFIGWLYLFFFISVVYIKNEVEDAAFDVKFQPAKLLGKDDSIKPFIIEKQNQIIGPADCMNELDIKDKPLPDDEVSKWQVKAFLIIAIKICIRLARYIREIV